KRSNRSQKSSIADASPIVSPGGIARRMDSCAVAPYGAPLAGLSWEPGAEAAMTQFGIGQPVRRVEDRRFLTGRGHYLDDIVRPRQVHAVMRRSPHAHARIRAIDTRAAAGPGILAILTGTGLAKDGIGRIPCMSGVTNRDKSAMAMPPRPAIV